VSQLVITQVYGAHCTYSVFDTTKTGETIATLRTAEQFEPLHNEATALFVFVHALAKLAL
jgi:hypothetical protein